MNRVSLIGRLTKDPEIRYTQNGIAQSRFILAVNRKKGKKDGNQQNEQQEQADFINCVAWRKTAENLANFQRKGALILVEGRIQTGSYESQDGKRVYTTDIMVDNIEFLEPRKHQEGSGQYPQQQGYNAPPQQNYQAPPGQHPPYQTPPAGQQPYQQQYQAPPQQPYPPYDYNPPYR